jgi:hypothetical protein
MCAAAHRTKTNRKDRSTPSGTYNVAVRVAMPPTSLGERVEVSWTGQHSQCHVGDHSACGENCPCATSYESGAVGSPSCEGKVHSLQPTYEHMCSREPLLIALHPDLKVCMQSSRPPSPAPLSLSLSSLSSSFSCLGVALPLSAGRFSSWAP